MQTAFLIIITLVGAIYALVTKQGRVALGLLVLAISFVLSIEGLVSGLWTNFLIALFLIIFALGIFTIVWKKKSKVETQEEKVTESSDNTPNM